MKIQTTTLLLMSGLLALFNVPAPAQENPASPSKPEEVKRPDASASPERQRGPGSPEEKPTAYLGVLTAQVSRELRAQFGLGEGFGLQVAEVMPDSPAKDAGLKEHDVLVAFEDQKLVNMEQLQTLVRSKKKGDAVSLSIITGGQAKQISVKIGERMMSVNAERPRGFMPGFSDMRGGEWGNMEQWRDSAQEFQRGTREYQERIQQWNRDGHRGPMPQPPMFKGPGRKDGDRRADERGPRDDESRHSGPPDGDRKSEQRRFEHSESHASANVTRSDDTGIYSLRKNDGSQIFTVKPKDGEEKSWPVNNDAERAAVPEPYLSRLREMDQIRTNMRSTEEPPQEGERRPAPENDVRDTPPPTKRPTGA
jgi:PDZ domain